jgi:superfamily II DNA or RNA helicase
MTLQSNTFDAYPAGTRLRQISNPAIVGHATGHAEPRDGYCLVEVTLPDGTIKRWRSTNVEPAPLILSRARAFAEGRFGGTSNLRRALMLERLRGDLTDVFYSMGTSDTEFMPHQFKPVLRFVESVTGRLLIADEVGLGKTIEAVLIWKELEAREQARRLLVVCPSMLREKWRTELIRRFRIDSQVVGAEGLKEACEAALRNHTKAFALIAGFDGLRPRSARAKEASEGRVNARDQLERLLEEHPADPDFALFDYVVVDEAHYARNRETATNKLVRALNDAAAHMALLTATPIQLNEDNLYQLMRLVDPERFDDADVFRRLMIANQPIVALHYSLRQSPFDHQAARRAIERAREGQMADDPVLIRAAEALAADEITLDSRVELARAIERASVLASVMVRSRKREVLENRVRRHPHALIVPLKPIEKSFYDRVTKAILARSRSMSEDQRSAVAQLALITRQRQMASSMPAAALAWQENSAIQEQLFEDFGLDEEIDSVEIDIKMPDAAALEAADSKFEILREHLKRRRDADPNEKFVLFSFFRGTLAYLSERLQREGLATFVLRGGMDSKDAVLSAFREHPSSAILLSSEVGSEGIDLQFCRTLINYDLPWNPMKVEQRIGRLDRIGQTSDRIHIVNLVLQETVEDRILNRLYERIGVFERAIGDLESILGDSVQELVLSLYQDDLDEAEREAKAEQTISALAERARSLGELEEQVSNLVAFKDHLLEELRDGRDLGRWIEPDDLLAFCIDALSERYPGSKVERRHGDGRIHRIALSSDAKVDLETFMARYTPSRSTRMHTPAAVVDATFDPHWRGAIRPTPEFIEATHPLILWLRSELKGDPESIYPAAAIELPRAIASVEPGTYVVAIDRWEIGGLRRERRLRFLGVHLEAAKVLDGVEAERLTQRALRDGATLSVEMLSEIEEILPEALNFLAETLENEFHDRVDLFEAENASLCDRQLEAVELSASRRISNLQARLEQLHSGRYEPGGRRVEPLIRARLAKVEERLKMQRKKLSASRLVESESFETAGVVVVVPA